MGAAPAHLPLHPQCLAQGPTHVGAWLVFANGRQVSRQAGSALNELTRQLGSSRGQTISIQWGTSQMEVCMGQQCTMERTLKSTWESQKRLGREVDPWMI